jgi:hypothetical protein
MNFLSIILKISVPISQLRLYDKDRYLFLEPYEIHKHIARAKVTGVKDNFRINK